MSALATFVEIELVPNNENLYRFKMAQAKCTTRGKTLKRATRKCGK
jgi:hypothetical protein